MCFENNSNTRDVYVPCNTTLSDLQIRLAEQ